MGEAGKKIRQDQKDYALGQGRRPAGARVIEDHEDHEADEKYIYDIAETDAGQKRRHIYVHDIPPFAL